MKFSRDDIIKMKEDDLRDKVLRPLFEKMGFRDVFIHHGGAGEQGKDFVMWKAGELNERINYAVVAKATRITGQANTKSGSAGEVAIQVQQAFGTRFLDPVTTEEQRVHTCWVICSREISKEAEQSIKSVLVNAQLDRSTRFVNGDRLWEMIQRNFPETTAFENLRQITEAFENIDKSGNWRVTFSTRGGKPSFGIEPKITDKPIKPLELEFNLHFANDDDGRAKLEELKTAVEKGGPIELESRYLSGAKMPDFLKSIVGDVHSLKIEHQKSSKIYPVDCTVESDDGARFQLAQIELMAERIGTQEALLSNRHQKMPWIFEMKINPNNRESLLTWHISISDFNAHLLLKAVQLWQSISKPGKLTISNSKTGIPVIENRLIGTFADAPSGWLLSIVSDLDFIQKSTNKEYHLPSGKIDGRDLIHTHIIAELLRTGKCVAQGLKVSQTYDRINAENLLRSIDSETGVPLTMRGVNFFEKVLGQPVPLGIVVLHIPHARIAETCIESIRKELDKSHVNEFSVTFEPIGETSSEFYCLTRLPKGIDLPEQVKAMFKDDEPASPID